MINSKKAQEFDPIVSIIALLFIFIMLIIFFSLFKSAKEGDASLTKNAFSSVDTELTLKTFLRTPTSLNPESIDMFPGEQVTAGDIIVRTCGVDSKSASEFIKLKESAEEYFNKIYGNKWLIFMAYYTPDGTPGITPSEVKPYTIKPAGGSINLPADKVTSGEFKNKLASGSSEIEQAIAFLEVNVREQRVGSQVLPCIKESTVVKMGLFVDSDLKGKWP